MVGYERFIAAKPGRLGAFQLEEDSKEKRMEKRKEVKPYTPISPALERKNIVVLVEPEIPYNTGNIARTCVSTNTALHLVEPLGFSIDSKQVKRAGLDYWEEVELEVWPSFEDFKVFLEKAVEDGYQAIYATTKADRHLGDLEVSGPCIILFGKETAGLPEDFILENPQRGIRIPMFDTYRSLNLSNSEAIVLYEVLRQQNYPGLH